MKKADESRIRAAEPSKDGSYPAVIIHCRAECGVLVWAGRLAEGSLKDFDSGQSPPNFLHREIVSFMSWRDVAEYFEGREYAPLIQQFQDEHMDHRPARVMAGG